MKYLKLQPAPETDQLTEDGAELTKLPWPIAVLPEPQGHLLNAEIYGGTVERVVGFQRDLAKHVLDVTWHPSLFLDPSKLVGLYVVTADKDDNWGVHRTAIMSAEVVGE